MLDERDIRPADQAGSVGEALVTVVGRPDDSKIVVVAEPIEPQAGRIISAVASQDVLKYWLGPVVLSLLRGDPDNFHPRIQLVHHARACHTRRVAISMTDCLRLSRLVTETTHEVEDGAVRVDEPEPLIVQARLPGHDPGGVELSSVPGFQ